MMTGLTGTSPIPLEYTADSRAAGRIYWVAKKGRQLLGTRIQARYQLIIAIT